jgi:hypothetical protein
MAILGEDFHAEPRNALGVEDSTMRPQLLREPRVSYGEIERGLGSLDSKGRPSDARRVVADVREPPAVPPHHDDHVPERISVRGYFTHLREPLYPVEPQHHGRPA